MNINYYFPVTFPTIKTDENEYCYELISKKKYQNVQYLILQYENKNKYVLMLNRL